jgi:1-acyl-sn-glycerol-3-phosphate acyltransferase
MVGGENIPLQDGVVLASNHISLLDTLLIPYSVMAIRGVQFVWSPAKAELFGLPVVGRILGSWGAFPVRRGRADLRAIHRIEAHMQTGKVMLFPEGTRNSDGRLGKGKRTVGKLIYNVRPIVVPLAVWGTNQVWPKGWRLIRWRPSIGVRYGQPLDLQSYYDLPDTKETAEAIVEEIMRAIARQLAHHETSARPLAKRKGGSEEGCHGSSAV